MTTTISGSTGIDKVQAGAVTRDKLPVGTVLQVVQVVKTDTFSTTSASFVDVTGLSASITPTSTTSKILVTVQVVHGTANAAVQQFRLTRGGSAIAVGASAGSRTPTTFAGYYGASDYISHLASSIVSYLDSPASTSSQTYTVQTKVQGTNTQYINRSNADADNNDYGTRSISTITITEIAA